MRLKKRLREEISKVLTLLASFSLVVVSLASILIVQVQMRLVALLAQPSWFLSMLTRLWKGEHGLHAARADGSVQEPDLARLRKMEILVEVVVLDNDGVNTTRKALWRH